MSYLKQPLTFSSLFIVLFSVCFILSCKREFSPDIYSINMPDSDIHNIYVYSFPTDLYVVEKQKLNIENANVIIGFVSVLETFNNGDAKILLEMDYHSKVNRIVLFVKSSPNVYYLENDKQYIITLKKLNKVNGAYQLLFTINKYAQLK